MAAPTRTGALAATGNVIAAHIVAAVDDGPASDRPAYARADQKVALFAVLEITIGGKKITAVPLAQAPAVELMWNRIEPTSANISNGDPSTFHFHTIEYQPTAIATGTPSITLMFGPRSRPITATASAR